MKTIKKIGALALALALVLALGVTAFADSTVVTGNYDANAGTNTTVVTTSGSESITLSKTIVYFNPDGVAVREPDIDYSYTIAPETMDGTTTVIDINNNSPVVVLTGATGGVATSATISINPGTSVTATTAGSPKVYTTALSVDMTKFTHAGIYRYKITETNTDIAVASTGVLRASDANNEIRYMDVYIKNGTSGLELQGATIFKVNSSIDGHATGVYTTKTIGFDVTQTSGYDSDTGVDRYYTYNLTFTKTTTGSLADKTHVFPIDVTIAKAVGLADNATVDVSVNSGNTLVSSPTMTLGTSTTFQAKLKDGGELYVQGIPYYPNESSPTYATVTSVKEDNDTADYYTPSVTTKTNLTDGSPAIAFDGNKINPSANKTTTGTVVFQAAQYKPVLGITNTLEEISPTGVVLRFAPYVLMLGAAAALVILTRKRRDAEEA